MVSDKDIIFKRLKTEHEFREDKILEEHKIEKNIEKYSNRINGEMKRYRRVLQALEDYYGTTA